MTTARYLSNESEVRARLDDLYGPNPDRLLAPMNGPMDPVHPCRLLSTRHCPAIYEDVCGDRPCARYESNDEAPWLREVTSMAIPVHGKPSTYTNHRCRCLACTEAWTAYMKSRRYANKQHAAMLPENMHGKDSTYVNYMCRCNACGTAHREARQRYVAQRKQQQRPE